MDSRRYYFLDATTQGLAMKLSFPSNIIISSCSPGFQLIFRIIDVDYFISSRLGMLLKAIRFDQGIDLATKLEFEDIESVYVTIKETGGGN